MEKIHTFCICACHAIKNYCVLLVAQTKNEKETQQQKITDLFKCVCLAKANANGKIEANLVP